MSGVTYVAARTCGELEPNVAIATAMASSKLLEAVVYEKYTIHKYGNNGTKCCSIDLQMPGQ
jgi:hypothetical protein